MHAEAGHRCGVCIGGLPSIVHNSMSKLRGTGTIIGGNGQIAGGDQLAARRGGDPFHFGNDRLRQAYNTQHHGGAGGEKVLKILESAIGVGPPRRHFFEVMAGTEMIAGAAYDHRFYPSIFGDLIKSLRQRGKHCQAERIDRPRRIEGKDRYPIAIFFCSFSKYGLATK